MKRGVVYEPHIGWAFAWSTGVPKPYLTSLAACTRRELIRKVEDCLQKKWRHIYRRGGRAVKCRTEPLHQLANEAFVSPTPQDVAKRIDELLQEQKR